MNDQLINPYAFVCKVKPECNEMYPWSDIGDSRLFAHCYKGIVRYVPERKCWYVYHDGIWQEDLGGLRVMALCKEFACALKRYSKTIQDDTKQKYYAEYCKKWQRRSGRETILKDSYDICPTSMHIVRFRMITLPPAMLFNPHPHLAPQRSTIPRILLHSTAPLSAVTPLARLVN